VGKVVGGRWVGKKANRDNKRWGDTEQKSELEQGRRREGGKVSKTGGMKGGTKKSKPLLIEIRTLPSGRKMNPVRRKPKKS